MVDFQTILRPYNPWWTELKTAFDKLPAFQRPIYSILCEAIENIPQVLSVTGPRRIGKSTLLRQLIRKLLNDGIPPDRLIYYSFDDPALDRRRIKIDELIDWLMKNAFKKKEQGLTFLFLDEIQRLERWELYLKKYYDLKYPVKLLISGSASSPIFSKSRESLLGRIKDYHLLPFSFREYVLYSLQENAALLQESENLYEMGKVAQGIATEDPYIQENEAPIPMPSAQLQVGLDQLLQHYFLEGGFPEVWSLPDWVAKQDYLYDNQVNKVIYEDLVLAAEFRKPELLKRFYISLLERPGKEVNIRSVAKETEVNVSQIDKYLPLLELTDLVYHIEKFRASSLRVRKGMMKFYLVDLALRNAVLRLNENLLADQTMLGLYAENLVFLALKKWRGAIQMDYYRERDAEVDFVAHICPGKYLPVEVKYRNDITSTDFTGLRKFTDKYQVEMWPIMVSKKWSDFGRRNDSAFLLPLPLFLMLFD